MSTKTFAKEYLVEELELPYNSEHVLSDNIVDNSRWSIFHELIFKDPSDGKCYSVEYSVGATEMQDERPWEYENFIEATEVKKKTIVTEEYVSVDAPIRDLEDVLQEIRENVFAIEDGECVVSFYDVEQALENWSKPLPVAEQQETAEPETVREEVEEQQSETSINQEDFQKFFDKFKKKMDDVFYLYEETTMLELGNSPSPDRIFSVTCEDDSILSYRLSDLYEEYKNNKASNVEKPLKAIVNRIESEYDERCVELDEEEEEEYEYE